MTCRVCDGELHETDVLKEHDCFHVYHYSCAPQKCPFCTSISATMEEKKISPLTLEARRIILSLSKGKNVIMQGPGGTGKSYTIARLRDYYAHKGFNIFVTALTGVAALNISGKTLHSWSGHGLLDRPFEHYVTSSNWGKGAKNIKETDILIVDEVSMLDSSTFELLERLCRYHRGVQSFFGGMKLVLCGDIMQLPPVKGSNFLYSPLMDFDMFDIHTFYEPKRYPDIKFYDSLMRLRRGILTTEDAEIFERKAKTFDSTELEKREIIPTILYATRANVESENNQKLNALPGKLFVYKSKDTVARGYEKESENILKTLSQPVLQLKVGAQVMHTINNVTLGLVNGSRGVVLQLFDDLVVVKYYDERVIPHSRHCFSHKINKRVEVVRRQFPFILSWATTIHKSQGTTLDCVICDLGSTVFCEGQAYVALSRVKTLEGLHLSAFDKKSIKVSKQDLEMLDTLEEKSLPIIVKN